VTAQALQAVVWDGADIEPVRELDEVRLAPVGTDVGDLTFTVGERTFSTDLVLDATIDDPGPWWRLGHPLELR
jgi:D-alanyl-D-alanine carboxypeptidase (penicillin-binding protein 5/6)